MQPPEGPTPTAQPEDRDQLRWFFGLLPYGSGTYRTGMALVTGTVLMGGAVRALMPEARTWPLEQFHISSRDNRFAPSRLEVADVDSLDLMRRRRSGPAPALARPEGARLRFASETSLPIRVLPDDAAEELPDSSFLRTAVLPPEASLPEPERELPRRRPPMRSDAPPALGAPRGRSTSGSSEEGTGPGTSVQQTPLIGARHEYDNQTEHEVVGNQLRTMSTPGTSGSASAEGQAAWGGTGGMPPRERLITSIRLAPERIDLEVGTSQAYDLQVQLDGGQWFSVTHWPETRFRLLTGNGGIEQHRQADNVLLGLLDTPERLNGSEVLFEGSLRLPGRSPLVARALVRLHIPHAEPARPPRVGR